LRTPTKLVPWAVIPVLAASADAATLHVPADHEKIQSAVLEAAPGDTVLVAPGRYVELVRMSPGVVLLSEEGPDSTTIAGADLAESALDERVIEVLEGDRSTVIEGFTVEPTELLGAGFYVENASPVIRGNVIRGFGWGIHLRSSESALIEDNVIRDCVAFGLLAFASSPEVYGNEFADNDPRAIAISGKESKPVIGGSPERRNSIYGSLHAIVNDSRNDIVATYNDWGWEVTTEMESGPWPVDVTAIMDGNDKESTRRGRGVVDYREWVSPDDVAGGEAGSPRWWIAALVAVVLIGVFVAISRRG
jgi:hypothetical protein